MQKRLIDFFTIPRQKENLENMQKELSYPDIHTVIRDITGLNKNYKKDGKRLERIMLNDSKSLIN
nr:13106_t:CDS:2 [Entrophospora candida]